MLAAAWGCTPAQLRACTMQEAREMLRAVELRAAAMAERA